MNTVLKQVNISFTSDAFRAHHSVGPLQAGKRIRTSEIDSEIRRRNFRVDSGRRLRPDLLVGSRTTTSIGRVIRRTSRWTSPPLGSAFVEETAISAGSSTVPVLSASILSGRSDFGTGGQLDRRRRPAGVRKSGRSSETGDTPSLVIGQRIGGRAVWRNWRAVVRIILTRRRKEVEARRRLGR
jgi:hypothetical protein